MNNIDIEKIKREIKVKVGGTAVFCGLLFTLMGCGKTVVDTTVEQQPTQTIETTIDDPVVDVPVVEPTADVSDNTTVEPEKDKPDFSDATFIQTGEHEYTINIDCPDNSAEILDPASIPFYEDSLIGNSNNFGISADLMNAIFTYGLQVDPSNPTHANIENYIDNPVLVNVHYFGSHNLTFSDDMTQYPDNYMVYSASNLSGVGHVSPNSEQCAACAVILKDAIVKCNGNLSCALGAYSMGSDWDIAMQECMDATGLTEEEIYKNYDAIFVASYAQQGLVDVDFINGVFRYINSPITISYYDENGHTVSSDTYDFDRVKKYGTI